MRPLTVAGERKICWNDSGNDLWIREVVFPRKRNGFFVEAGAADGTSGSSCFPLERYLGWTGICIEPHSAFFPELRRNRPGSTCLNVCLARNSGWVDYVESPQPYLSGIRESLLNGKDRGAAIVAEGVAVRKPAQTLGEILRSCHAPPVIDYAAFDIEGSEYEALREFPFGEFRFQALSAEVDWKISAPFTELLAANGYRETNNPFNQDAPWERYWLHEGMPK